MTFEEFLASTLRNVWVHEPGIAIYVRRSIRKKVDVDLASMDAEEPGKGALTKFLDKYETRHVFLVENIHNPRLAHYLERRMYIPFTIPGDYSCVPNMVSPNYGK